MSVVVSFMLLCLMFPPSSKWELESFLWVCWKLFCESVVFAQTANSRLAYVESLHRCRIFHVCTTMHPITEKSLLMKTSLKTMPSNFSDKRRKQLQFTEAPHRQTCEFIQIIQGQIRMLHRSYPDEWWVTMSVNFKHLPRCVIWCVSSPTPNTYGKPPCCASTE